MNHRILGCLLFVLVALDANAAAIAKISFSLTHECRATFNSDLFDSEFKIRSYLLNFVDPAAPTYSEQRDLETLVNNRRRSRAQENRYQDLLDRQDRYEHKRETARQLMHGAELEIAATVEALALRTIFADMRHTFQEWSDAGAFGSRDDEKELQKETLAALDQIIAKLTKISESGLLP
jgi:hypothetical protein